jgi:IS30 family transposase
MSSYRQLSLEERCAIAQLRAAGQSLREFAATLDRQPSTIAREVKRKSRAQVGYRPAYAQQLTQARRWTGSRLERDTGLRTSVLDRLRRGWSPKKIAGRLACEAGDRVISH